MKHLTSNLMMLASIVMLLSALMLGVHNVQEDQNGGIVSGEILAKLKTQIPDAPEIEPETIPENDLYYAYETEPAPEEMQIDIDQNKYIGILAIPSLGLELPVMSVWNYQNLKLAPCRYSGTVADGDLIIAAHNYRTHFGTINQLNSGDSILFTEGNGVVHTYELLYSEVLNGYDIAGMMAGAGEDWHLTLYTCTLSGASRVTIRAVEIEDEEE